MSEDQKKKRGRRGGKNKQEKRQKLEEERVQEDEIVFAEETQEAQFGIPDADTRSYFQQIENMLQEEVDDQELFLENVWEELNGKELMMASDFDGSRILEKLLRVSSDFQIRVFSDRLNGNYLQLFKHQYASHVCQTLLYLGADIVEREFKGYSKVQDSNLPTMERLVLLMGEQLNGEWLDLILHQYGSFVVRAYINVLAGESLVQDSNIRSKKSQKYNKKHQNQTERPKQARAVPSSFSTVLQQIVSDLVKQLTPPKMHQLAFDQVGNPVLQILVSLPQCGGEIIKSFMQDPDTINSLIRDQIGSHLVEKMIQHSDPSILKDFFETYFKEQFLYLCKDMVANFVVQRVIQKCPDESVYEEMLSYLPLAEFKELLFAARAGIIVSMAESAIRFPKQQSKFVQLLKDAFQCTDEPNIVYMILYMKPQPRFESHLMLPKIILHGALLLQHLFKFTKDNNKIFSNSMSGVKKEELQDWLKDPIASRVLDALLESPTVSKQAKRTIVEHFIPDMVKLAQDKYGSHFVDKCFSTGNLETKTMIAQKLGPKESSLKENFHAKFILRNCKIELFKRSNAEWIEVQKGEKKKHKKKQDEIDELFQGI
ncbi:armadillo-type protein [Gorgonomyces haynaldii]|nr:armadillo-type protein [Gorgonomyces haynaldii]